MIYTAIESLIGNTPLLKINATRYGIMHTDIYVKLEYLNPFGSIKDRTALGLTQSLGDDEAQYSDVIESSSGNTAKALQLLAARQGRTFTSVTNRIKVPEVEQQLRYLGANIVALPGRSECPDPNDSDNAIATIERMMRNEPGKYFHTSQYDNVANTAIHTATTAAEIYADLPYLDVVVTGVGTGGSSGGLIEYAKEHDLDTKHVGVVAHPSDFLPGIRTKNELFETKLFKQENFTEIVEVSSMDALTALRTLVLDEGVLAGPTTGANFAATLEYAKSHDTLRADGSNQSLVFIACDRLESYMSYIAHRQPELFNFHTLNDIYTLEVDEVDKQRIKKSADQSTMKWIHDANVTIVDTRGVRPYGNFHIEGSVNYPEEVLRELLSDGSPFEHDRPLLFVCPTGDRSDALALLLNERGFDAYSLEGGLMSWRAHKLPLQRKKALRE